MVATFEIEAQFNRNFDKIIATMPFVKKK